MASTSTIASCAQIKYSQNNFLCNSQSFANLNLFHSHFIAQKSTVSLIVQITCLG
ncbi:MAG: hypothetical protein LBQ24_05690 [Candidatus Peribacteria bacterium]|nr:hypothetical protein [Candidatus Peribacteria bacterium]